MHQIIAALPHVRYEIESLLLTPRHDPSDKTLVEAVELRRMVHARVLYSFFSRSLADRDESDPIDDDVLSEDYGFKAELPYSLEPRPLLDRFNKDIFHLTYTRLERTTESKPWPREELLTPIQRQAGRFIDHILQYRPDGVSDAEFRLWQKLKEDDTCVRPLQQNTSNVATVHAATLDVVPRRQRNPPG